MLTLSLGLPMSNVLGFVSNEEHLIKYETFDVFRIFFATVRVLKVQATINLSSSARISLGSSS